MLEPHAINLLKRLGERVVENYRDYDQSEWGRTHSVRGDICHTVHCFGGEICLMVDGQIPKDGCFSSGLGGPGSCYDRAKSILGLTELQAHELFLYYSPKFEADGTNELQSGTLEYAQRAREFLEEWIEKETRA